MKIQAYTSVLEKKSVKVLKREYANVRMLEIFKKNAISQEVFGIDAFPNSGEKILNLGTKKYGYKRQYRSGGEELLMQIPLKNGKKTDIVSGLIGFEKMEDVIRFLSEDVNPNGAGDLCAFLKKAMDKKGVVNKNTLNYILNGDNRWNSIRPPSGIVYMGKKMPDNDFYSREMEYSLQESVSDDKVFLAVQKDGNNGQRIMIKTSSKSFKGYDIPVVEYIYLGNDLIPMSANEGLINFAAVYYDGKFRTYEAIDDVNSGIIDDMEKNAIVYARSYVDLLPDNSKTPVAIVKVPTASEYRKVSKKINRTSALYFPKPLFVETSLKPFVFSEKLPVIDDPQIFFEIASRITSGIYLPGNRPVEVATDRLPAKTEFFVMSAVG
ncbi:MAG: hypothetical protein WCJ46_06930 [bacterium]